ncbi:hypothetical protein IWQ60_007978 [Tieghemiomyces parasiticus]|uniref:Uncharacterized protein n=1 Tax=Tieghemiomyces parasiticus TaxID=78921 RepID=A0A9W8A0X4_9FUNG|nr:hypothetical protein IWQ60_007978 [Tieghemiomyces parasiticus]
MPKCNHRGCEKEYDEASNGPNACQYHSGAPVFHEGLKGWSCCAKRVGDFDQFLAIPGCTTGEHSAAPVEKVEFSQPSTAEHLEKDYSAAPSTLSTPATAAPQSATPPTLATMAPSDKPQSKPSDCEEVGDAEGVEIPPGTACRHRGCGYHYESEAASRGNDSPAATCVYHPGAPIFHEGSKGWSCCKRRVLEFDEFLKIRGCKEGRHVFTDKGMVRKSGPETANPSANPSDAESQAAAVSTVQCRRDWYQTPTQVIASIFAKKIDKTQSRVEFRPQSLIVHLVMPEDQLYDAEIPLAFPIDPERSSFEFLSTKVEVVLQKTSGVSWPSLEPSANIRSWTTFGHGDSPLEVANGGNKGSSA